MTVLAVEAAEAAEGAGAAKAAGSSASSAARTPGGRGAGTRGGAARRKTAAPAPVPAPTAPALPPAPEGPAEAKQQSSPAQPGQAPDWLTDSSGAPSWWPSAGDGSPVRAANAGGGFLLGLVAWCVGITYLRGGRPAVVALLNAKFFNKVQQGGTQ